MKINEKQKNTRLTDDLLERFREVEPATIGHHLHYGFMDPSVKSMLDHKAVSLAEEGDVLVIDRTGDKKHAAVGEMVVYAAKARKLAGIIIDGPCTDIQALREIGLPVFATGRSAITTKLYGISGEINTTVQCGGVAVNSGDLIVADDNGVWVMDETVDYEDVLKKSKASEDREPYSKEKLDNGEVLSSLTKADKLIEEYFQKN